MSNVSTETAKAALAKILNDTSGFDLNELDGRSSFLELGFDSLFLIQFTQKIKSQLKVKLSFRQLIEDVPTIEALIDHVARHSANLAPATSLLPAIDPAAVAEPARSPITAPIEKLPTASENFKSSVASMCPDPVAPVAIASSIASSTDAQAPVANRLTFEDTNATFAPAGVRDLAGLEQIITQQNALMSMQLQLLSGSRVAQTSASLDGAGHAISSRAEVCSGSTAESSSPGRVVSAPTGGLSETAAAWLSSEHSGQGMETRSVEAKNGTESKFERFGPFKPVRKASDGGLTKTQRQSLEQFIQRFTQRTSRSRSHAQKHRPHFADPRGVAGYRRIWKSIVYQISVERSAGSKLWDIDGNEYIDIAMGFGLNLFGQSPDFVTAALQQQLQRGVEVGPQSPLAGEVAALLCDFSRKDRVTFCNTGSEAVMAAMRLARTVTGKDKVVFFNKDYHGNFEEVLLRSNQIGPHRLTQPAAPGIPQSFAESAIVLDYGTAAALETIRERADEIAAVLVEPVQSADPFTQPKQFLHEVRRITQDNNIALIMDEVITGFRAAQGGAQEWFDVWGDMATYGKILGGGLPMGALAGTRQYMDALDGGMWLYEDDSEPGADMTFFAGTFVRHPLAMTAAHQILMKIKEEGPELQEALTRKTTYLVDCLNGFFTEELFPFRVAQFTSLFRFMFPADLEYADLLYFHLLDRGIFTRGWGDNCFLSTAHSDEDVQRIIDAVKSSCRELREAGFMPAAETLVSKTCAASSSRLMSGFTSTSLAPVAALSAVFPTKAEPPLPSHSVSGGSSRISTLEEIQEAGELPPLFCMPAADGLSLVYHHLAEQLGDNQPVYGLTSPGVYGQEVPLTIEEMAHRFVQDIREFRPHGPYLLIGYCSGGTIAFEAAQQLVAAGEEVAMLAGIETYDWGTAQSSRPTAWIKFYYNVQRTEFHIRNFLLLGFRDQWAFLKSKLSRAQARTKNWRGMWAGLFSKQKAVADDGSVNMHELWRLHDAQADRYRPRPYPGKLLLIRPKKDYRSYVGKKDLLASEGVKVVRVPAFPAGLMTPPYVQQVAECIRQAISEGLSRRQAVASKARLAQPSASQDCGPHAHGSQTLAVAQM